MLTFFTDEDSDHRILRGVLRHLPQFDVLVLQEEGMSGTLDPGVLDAAAAEGRLLLTHDVNTMTNHAYQRMAEGLHCPGVIIVPRWLSIGQAVADIMLIAQAGMDSEFENQIRYLPLG